MNNQGTTGIQTRSFGINLHNRVRRGVNPQQPCPKPTLKSLSSLKQPSLCIESQQPITTMEIQQFQPESSKLSQQEIYIPEILTFLFSKSSTPISDYFQVQEEVTPHLRGVLVNWLVNVHSKYSLCSQTLYLCIYIVDKLLEKQSIPKKQLQLLGGTALWMASKYHEVYQVPKLSNLVLVCDNNFTLQDILVMEQKIIGHIGFNFLENTLIGYIEAIVKTGFLDAKDISFARYFAELSLVDWSVRLKEQKILAAGIIYLVKRMRKTMPYWNDQLINLTKVSEAEAKIVAKDIYLVLNNLQSNPCFFAIRSKYSTTDNHQVGKILFKQSV